MDILADINYFNIFHIDENFAICEKELSENFKQIQAHVHPDAHPNATEQEKKLAAQYSATINDGYRVLKDPILRAQHILALNGFELDLENEMIVNKEFLSEQMQLREQLFVLKTSEPNIEELENLKGEVKSLKELRLKELAELIDNVNDLGSALEMLKELVFFEKLEKDAQDLSNSSSVIP